MLDLLSEMQALWSSVSGGNDKLAKPRWANTGCSCVSHDFCML